MDTTNFKLPGSNRHIQIRRVHPIPVQSLSQANGQQNNGLRLCEIPRIQQMQLTRHSVIIIDKSQQIPIPFDRRSTPRNENRLLHHMRSTREINLRLPRAYIKMAQAVVQRIPTAEFRTDGLEIRCQAWIHQIHEAVCVGLGIEAVVDTVEFGVMLLKNPGVGEA